jgi:hypothetical protein
MTDELGLVVKVRVEPDIASIQQTKKQIQEVIEEPKKIDLSSVKGLKETKDELKRTIGVVDSLTRHLGLLEQQKARPRRHKAPEREKDPLEQTTAHNEEKPANVKDQAKTNVAKIVARVQTLQEWDKLGEYRAEHNQNMVQNSRFRQEVVPEQPDIRLADVNDRGNYKNMGTYLGRKKSILNDETRVPSILIGSISEFWTKLTDKLEFKSPISDFEQTLSILNHELEHWAQEFGLSSKELDLYMAASTNWRHDDTTKHRVDISEWDATNAETHPETGGYAIKMNYDQLRKTTENFGYNPAKKQLQIWDKINADKAAGRGTEPTKLDKQIAEWQVIKEFLAERGITPKGAGKFKDQSRGSIKPELMDPKRLAKIQKSISGPENKGNKKQVANMLGMDLDEYELLWRDYYTQKQLIQTAINRGIRGDELVEVEHTAFRRVDRNVGRRAGRHHPEVAAAHEVAKLVKQQKILEKHPAKKTEEELRLAKNVRKQGRRAKERANNQEIISVVEATRAKGLEPEPELAQQYTEIKTERAEKQQKRREKRVAEPHLPKKVEPIVKKAEETAKKVEVPDVEIPKTIGDWDKMSLRKRRIAMFELSHVMLAKLEAEEMKSPWNQSLVGKRLQALREKKLAKDTEHPTSETAKPGTEVLGQREYSKYLGENAPDILPNVGLKKKKQRRKDIETFISSRLTPKEQEKYQYDQKEKVIKKGLISIWSGRKKGILTNERRAPEADFIPRKGTDADKLRNYRDKEQKKLDEQKSLRYAKTDDWHEIMLSEADSIMQRIIDTESDSNATKVAGGGLAPIDTPMIDAYFKAHKKLPHLGAKYKKVMKAYYGINPNLIPGAEWKAEDWRTMGGVDPNALNDVQVKPERQGAPPKIPRWNKWALEEMKKDKSQARVDKWMVGEGNVAGEGPNAPKMGIGQNLGATMTNFMKGTNFASFSDTLRGLIQIPADFMGNMMGGGVVGGKGAGGGAAAGGAAAGGAAAAVMIAAGIIKDVLEKGFEFIQKLLKLIVDSSPRLQATFKVLMKGIMLFLRPIGDLLSTFIRPIARWFITLNRTAMNAARKAGKPGSQEFQGAYMTAWFDAFMKGFWENMAKPISGIFTTWLPKFLEQILPPILVALAVLLPLALGSLVIGIAKLAWDFLTWVVDKLGGGLTILSTIGNWIMNKLTTLITHAGGLEWIGSWIFTKFTTLIKDAGGLEGIGSWVFDKLKAFITSAGGLTGIGQWIFEKIQTLITGIGGLTGIGEWIFSKIKELVTSMGGLVGIGDWIFSKIKELVTMENVNQLAEAMFHDRLASLNNTLRDLLIPDFLGKDIRPFGGINVMPYTLADAGGISNGPTPVMFGERRREVIAPLSDLPRLLAAAMEPMQTSTQPITIVIPGDAIANAIDRRIDFYYKTKVMAR